MRVEASTGNALSERSDFSIVFPSVKFDLTRLREGVNGAGVALIILRNPSNPEILLGNHNSKSLDPSKHGKWCFFIETQEPEDTTTSRILSERLIPEELGLSAEQLELATPIDRSPMVVVQDIDRGDGVFDVAGYVVWTDQALAGEINSPEIAEAKFFKLSDVLNDNAGVPLRSFAADVLHKLAPLIMPPVSPLRKVEFLL